MADIKPPKAGELITEGLLSRIVGRFTRFDNIRSDSPYIRIMDGPNGKDLALDLPQPTRALLSGPTSPYSWTEVTEGPSGTWVAMPGGDSGTAYEANGKSGLAGKVVPITWTSAGDWRFQWVGFGCSTNTLTFNLQQCGTNPCPIVGASVDFILGGVTVFTGTTNSSGQVILTGASPGSYDISWSLASPSLSGSFAGVFTVTGACENRVATRHMATPPGAPDYACDFCGPEPVPQLYVTDNQGTRPTDVCTAGTVGGYHMSAIFVVASNCAGTGTLLDVQRLEWSTLNPTCAGAPGGGFTATNVPISCTRPFFASGTYPLGGGAFTVHE